MQFITRCVECGDQNELGDNDRASIKLSFHKGTPNTLDRMHIYCTNCGNNKEIGIIWPFDIINIANDTKPTQPDPKAPAED